jgi:protein SCO1/2
MSRLTGRARLLMLAVIALAVPLTACGDGGGHDGQPTATRLPGTVLDPPKDIGAFTLTDQDGEPFSIDTLRGQAVIVYFGYTNCPDVCPTTLSNYKQVKAALGADADRVAFVFISVDGARDTPQRLKTYLGAFDPAFIGLTGDDAPLRPIAQEFGVFFQRVTSDQTQENYSVDHTASTFVLGPDGRLRMVFSYGVDPAILAQRIRSDVLGG